jgi:hypothetical protein
VKGHVDLSGGDLIARNGNLYIAGNASLNKNVYIKEKLTIGVTDSLYTLDVSGSSNLQKNLTVVGDVSINGNLYANYPPQTIPASAIIGGSLTVSTIDINNTIGNVNTQINTIRFDTDSGFSVDPLETGVVKVGMNSTFKYWDVSGQVTSGTVGNLTAYGLDRITFVPGNNISISTSQPSDKKLLTVTAVNVVNTTSDQTVNGNKTFTNDVSLNTNLSIGGNVVINKDLNVIGNLTAVTQTATDNSKKVATTEFVKTQITNLVGGATTALDTLNELATALGNDANFSTTVTNTLATKAPLASPSLTGTPTAPTASVDTNTTQIATTEFVINQGYMKSANVTGDFYNKSYVDASFVSVYTKTVVDSSINTNFYNKTQADTSLNTGFYNKTQADTSMNSNFYNKTYVDTSFVSVYTKTVIDSSVNSNFYN